jgi:hypothetical protein
MIKWERDLAHVTHIPRRMKARVISGKALLPALSGEDAGAPWIAIFGSNSISKRAKGLFVHKPAKIVRLFQN